jgi:hypothetical protein
LRSLVQVINRGYSHKPLSILFTLGAQQSRVMETLQSGGETEEQPLPGIRHIGSGGHGPVYEVLNSVEAANSLDNLE